MRKSSVRLIVSGVAVALVAAAVPLFATHSWGGYHWARTTSQFTLKVGDNMSADWKPFLAQASSDWNSPAVWGWRGPQPLLTAVVAGQSTQKRCRMVAGTTQVCNGAYGFNGWLGLASINVSGGEHITQGSAKMNDSYFNSSTYNNPNEKQHVVCQEIAHTFGLDHQDETGASLDTCMDYFSNTGRNAGSAQSTTPNYHDFEELANIYGHTDSTTTVALAPSSAASGVDISDDPNSWGQLMSQSRNGRSSTYERFNHDGSKTVTHVFWTLEAAENCPSCDHRFDR